MGSLVSKFRVNLALSILRLSNIIEESNKAAASLKQALLESRRGINQALKLERELQKNEMENETKNLIQSKTTKPSHRTEELRIKNLSEKKVTAVYKNPYFPCILSPTRNKE